MTPLPQQLLRATLVISLMLGASSSRLAAQPPTKPEETPEYKTLWKHGDYEKALSSLFREINEMRRINVQWALDRAQLRFETGAIDLAINDMELIVGQIPQASYIVKLAEFYRYRGNDELMNAQLSHAESIFERMADGDLSPENGLAHARYLELKGENPRTILGTAYASLHDLHPEYAPGFTSAGDLALTHGDYALAQEFYEKAIAIDAEEVDALTGLAECFWRSGDQRFDETLSKVAAINPRFPRAKALEVAAGLEAGKVDASMKIIDKMFEFNPHHDLFNGLRPAALFLKGDLKGMEEAQAAAIGFNPHWSQTYRIPGEIASRQYRFKEGAAFQRKALEADPKDVRAKTMLAFDLLRTGGEEEGRKLAQEAFDADPFNVQLYNMLKLMDTLDGYAVVARGHFVLKVPKAEQIILADDALNMLEEAYARYTKEYKVELETPILVQIFQSHDDFMVRSVGLPGQAGYLGICFGRLVTMDSPTARSKWSANWHSVLWHEFVHVITLQKTRNRMPRWFSEGISVFEETRKDPAWGQRLEPEYKTIAAEGPLPGLSNLETYFTQPRTPGHLMFGYFLGGEFVKFYVEQYGFDALRESLRLIGEGPGGPCEPMLAAASGKDIDTVDRDFQAYLKKRLAPYDNLPEIPKSKDIVPGMMDEGTSKTLARAPWAKADSPFTTALDKATEAVKNANWKEAETQLLKAHELYPDYMGADSPLRRLAEVYEKSGQRPKLIETLHRELAINGTDFAACIRLAELAREDKDWTALLAVARKASGIDPFDPAMRRNEYDALVKLGRDRDAMRALDQLITIDAPSAVDYRLGRVDALIRLKEWNPARREVLELLEQTPNFRKAQERLLDIVDNPATKESADAFSN